MTESRRSLSLPATSETETLLQVMKDTAEIESLVRRYADLCDEAYDPDKLSVLFTEDAVWEASSASGTSDFGVHRGPDAIYEHFAAASSRILHSHHIVMSPEIDVVEPGARARGRWNTMVWMRLADDPLARDDEESKLISSVYTHEYRHTGDGWKFSHLHVHTRFDLRVRTVG